MWTAKRQIGLKIKGELNVWTTMSRGLRDMAIFPPPHPKSSPTASWGDTQRPFRGELLLSLEKPLCFSDQYFEMHEPKGVHHSFNTSSFGVGCLQQRQLNLSDVFPRFLKITQLKIRWLAKTVGRLSNSEDPLKNNTLELTFPLVIISLLNDWNALFTKS